jgi:hypothetical protein
MSVADNNPLIDTNAATTLDRCADVIDYMAFYDGEHDAGDPSDNVRCGKILILDCVISALRYESARAGEQGKLTRNERKQWKCSHE